MNANVSARRRLPLLREVGGAHTALELAEHVINGDVPGLEHDQEMIEQVGGLIDQSRIVLGDRRDGDFYGLLAKLLGGLERRVVEQPPCVRVLWPCGPPRLDVGGEAAEHVVVAHVLAHTRIGGCLWVDTNVLENNQKLSAMTI